VTATGTFQTERFLYWDAPLNSYRCERGVPGLFRYEGEESDGRWVAVPGADDFLCSTLKGFRVKVSAYAAVLNLH